MTKPHDITHLFFVRNSKKRMWIEIYGYLDIWIGYKRISGVYKHEWKWPDINKHENWKYMPLISIQASKESPQIELLSGSPPVNIAGNTPFGLIPEDTATHVQYFFKDTLAGRKISIFGQTLVFRKAALKKAAETRPALLDFIYLSFFGPR